MSNASSYQAGFQAANRQRLMLASVKKMSADELDAVLRRTEYTDGAVTLGQSAADDQDLRRAAQAELDRRMFGKNA